MRLSSIKPGDIVRCNKKGRLFHAKVTGAGVGGTLIVAPIERNISYRHIAASEIADHWSHSVATRRTDRRPPTQTALDLDSAR
jgi:mevalonate kinase